MPFDFALRHFSGVQRNDLLVEPIETLLIFLNKLRLELAVAISGYVYFDLTALAFERFRACAVSGITGIVAG